MQGLPLGDRQLRSEDERAAEAKRVIIMGMTTASAPTRRLSTGLSPGMLVVLGALSAFGPLSTDMYLPGLPAMARDLGVSPSTAQLTLSGCLIGLAIGQLIAGPLSDALGRRKPLLLGLVAYVAASTLCAVSPGIAVLLAARFVQGLAGAAGIAIARAIVRDRFEGVAAARAYAMLMVVTGLGPIVAPIAGGLLLHVTDWRGIFVALAAIGALILVGAAVLIPETLSPQARHSGGLPTTRAAIGILLHDRRYVGHTLACALAFGTLMAYISASPSCSSRFTGYPPRASALCLPPMAARSSSRGRSARPTWGASARAQSCAAGSSVSSPPPSAS